MPSNSHLPQRVRSMSRSVLAVSSAITALTLAGAANAQSFAPYAYIGGSYGATSAQGDFNGQVFRAGQSLTGGNVIANIRSDRSDSGGKAFVGYQFHRNIAAELSYVDYGRFNASYDYSGPTTFSRQYVARWRADGVALDLVGSV